MMYTDGVKHGSAVGCGGLTQYDLELAQVIKEQAAYVASRVDEANEITRRELWVRAYTATYDGTNRDQHTRSKNAADSALAAYDEKFGK